MSKHNKKSAQQDTFLAQVISSHGRHHFVRDESGTLFEAHRRGKKGDVVVGDYVCCSSAVDNTVAIESIEPRQSLLFRQDEWRTKTLAANIDRLVIVFASAPRFNPWFVWKALLAAHQAKVHPIVLRNKTDLANGSSEAANFLADLSKMGYKTYELSALNHSDETMALLNRLFDAHHSLLVGQSGMGKSTILNLLVKDANARTQEYSQALNLGRQTTTSTTLYDLDSKQGTIIDSPGFQEFGLAHLELNDILRAMPDILPHIEGCRFVNCRHLKEPNCAVKAAVENGLISQARYDFYVAIVNQLDQLNAW